MPDMLGTPNANLSMRLARLVPGLRRVDWVRVTVGSGQCRAEAVGARHRLPAVAPLPLRMVAELARVGVPVVIHHTHRPDPIGG